MVHAFVILPLFSSPEKSRGMADKAEKDLDQANDCSWVRGLDAAGNPIKIAKYEFVQSTKAYVSPISVPYDANDIIENGSVTVVIGNIAGYETLYKNYPSTYGVLFNINGGEYFSAQMFFEPIGLVRVRIKNNETWGEWSLISFT